jgi:hypothetical protein
MDMDMNLQKVDMCLRLEYKGVELVNLITCQSRFTLFSWLPRARIDRCI